MTRNLTVVAMFTATLLVSGCGLPDRLLERFQTNATSKFDDQHFKTAIALVELHRVRSGAYPECLCDIKFTGDWDQIALSSVTYKRIGNGYSLDLSGWGDPTRVKLAPDFWRGLGIVSSNVPGVQKQ